MPFSDYLDLRTEVLGQIARPELAEMFDTITVLAESSLNRELKTRNQITETSITVASGEADLPDDFASVIGLFDGSGKKYTQQTTIYERGANNRAFYAISGNKLRAQDGDYTLEYYAKIPSLTTSMATSNWLLEGYPDVYLWACCVEASRRVRDLEALRAYSQLLSEAKRDLAADDHRARYAQATVRVVGVTP
ncbi:phage adaptor protein [Celeribacter sp. SCSIO 80788]|uniref:phage adaptor protein n=1 Tax=Celeribacter sp. SCSIO 80788 TaxID=3117013 RepID=UPI003DA52893